VWLSPRDQQLLLDHLGDEYPIRRLGLQLGLHGLRTDEVVQVEPRHVQELHAEGHEYRLMLPDGKTGRRELPISPDIRDNIKYRKNFGNIRQDDPVIPVSKRSMRDWIQQAREELAGLEDDDRWLNLSMHDLRRTWATDTFYSLAVAGNPIAEELTMSWGGWRHTDAGRETFRKDYLGPVPDHVTADAMQHLSLP